MKLHRRMTEKNMERREQTRQQRQEARAQIKEQLETARKIPLDVLAADWLNNAPIDAQTRIYLVESCLGTVVMALEKLLKEAERKEVLDADRMTSSFNPINYLAQALMRSNPRFSNFAEASPYMKSMRRVELELRDRVYEAAEDQQDRHRGVAREDLIDPLARHQHID